MTDQAVANPPAGGDQAFASTNDDNQNILLQTLPWLVVISANGQVGVVDRFPDKAAADNAAAARKAAETLPATTRLDVMIEGDLPAFLGKVEAAHAGVDVDKDAAPKAEPTRPSVRADR